MLLCVGVLLVTTTIQALALSYSVTARVPAPLPPTPAVIQIAIPVHTSANHNDRDDHPTASQSATTPQTAIHSDDKTITLAGDCPKDSHIKIYVNEDLRGVAPCIGDPTFSIEIDLVPGLNKITARVFNITEDEGPLSQPIYISYDVSPSAGQSPLLTTNFQYFGFLVGQKGNWDITVAGGTPPYSFVINWGDGSSSNYDLLNPGVLPISHVYKKASSNTGFVISVNATDSVGQTAVFQLLTVVSDRGSHQASLVAIANSSLSPPLITQIRKWLWVEWPAYLVLVLMVTSFWLGEREEYRRLIRRVQRRHAYR